MILPLQLRQGTPAAVEPKAWFLPGNSAARWLDELVRGGLATLNPRLFIVPTSVTDRTPAGLLVVPTQGGERRHKPAGLACRLIAARLFVPMDAVLHPPVTDEEVRRACLLPVTFYHPVHGLSSFEDEAGLRVPDLILLPEENRGGWNQARMGAPVLPELSAVVLAQPPSLADIFGGAEDDIGSEAPLDLPPAPDEPKDDALAKSARTLKKWFAKGLSSAMRQVPHVGKKRTWVNGAEDWANQQLSGINEQLQRLRQRELNRLLHLFKTDPEEALRHAIPLSTFAHRGKAPPGGQLGSRPLNFDLSRLGGRAADFWNISGDHQQQLRNHYRQMADREMQLGRHRRAAYIYAELLGDLVSAANALKQGKHFREAAILYDEHLKNPLEAVRCLAEAGLLAEAIERYEKMGRWLDVADLQERLGNPTAAREALRQVVNERLAQEDILGAVKLVDERLHETEEALSLLMGAWPASRQATSCVGAAFEMLARLGRHEVALEWIGRFQRQTAEPQMMPLIVALGGPARNYPNEAVRHVAADFSRVLIAKQLDQKQLPEAESSRLMTHLTRLAPQDRLLARDANRYLAAQRETGLRVRRVMPPPLPGNQPVVVRRFELPRQMEWLELRSEWHFLYALGVTHTHLTLVRGVWDGEFQSQTWDCPATTVKSGLLFEPTRQQGQAVILKAANGTDFPAKNFPATDRFFGTNCSGGTPKWLERHHWPVAFGDESIWTAHVAVGRAVVSCHDKNGKLLRTIDVTEELLAGAERSGETRLCLTATGNNMAIALGNRLVLTRSDGTLLRLELPGQARRLFATLPHTRAGLAIMLEHGAAIYWLGAPGLIELDRDIVSPQGVFVPGGPLVLISQTVMLLLDVDARGVHKVTRTPITGQRPVGVTATASPGQFAVLGTKGELVVYRVP